MLTVLEPELELSVFSSSVLPQETAEERLMTISDGPASAVELLKRFPISSAS